MEDNSATLQIIATGKNPKLKHVNRTQKVNIKRLHDIFAQNKDTFFMSLCPTKGRKADIFTKPFTGIPEWRHACSPIGVDIPMTTLQGISVDNKLYSGGDKCTKGGMLVGQPRSRMGLNQIALHARSISSNGGTINVVIYVAF